MVKQLGRLSLFLFIGLLIFIRCEDKKNHTPTITFTKTFGGGGNDVWLIKTDSHGNEEWNQTFGGSEHDHCWSGQQTNDGGYIIIGNTESYSVNKDILLIKTDSEGNEEWNRIFSGSCWSDDRGYSVQQTADGGFILTGDIGCIGNGWGDVFLI